MQDLATRPPPRLTGGKGNCVLPTNGILEAKQMAESKTSMVIQHLRFSWAKWCGLIAAAISLGTIVTVKAIFIFQFGSNAQWLLMVSKLIAVIGVTFSLVTFPSWQSIIALLIVLVTSYLLFLGPVPYAIS